MERDIWMNSVGATHSGALIETSLTGQLLLDNPMLNKGSAFSQDERREFGLLGLLPPHSSTVEVRQQKRRRHFRLSGRSLVHPKNLTSCLNASLDYKISRINKIRRSPALR